MLGIPPVHSSFGILTTTYFIPPEWVHAIFGRSYSIPHNICIFSAANSREAGRLVTVVAIDWVIVIIILLEVLA